MEIWESTGSYCVSLAGEGVEGATHTPLERVDRVKGVGQWHAPPPSASWAENAIITEMKKVDISSLLYS